MNKSMSIRQAARWANGKQAWDLCAVYDINTNLVECLGAYEKCSHYIVDRGAKHSPCTGIAQEVQDGRYLRMESLDVVMQEIEEEEGEANCIPEPGWIREWM